MPPTATVAALVDPVPRRPDAARGRGRFYTGMALVAFAIVIAGFGPAVFNPDGRKAPVTLWVGFHGALFTAWLMLFLAQTLLVGRGRMSAHRSLGYVGAAVALLMIGSGYATAVMMARRGFDLSGDLNAAADPHGFLVFQLGDLLSFGILVGAAVALRRRPEAHKRLMLLATVGSLMAAPLTHLLSHFAWARQHPPVILVPLTLLYASSAVHDRLTRGRIHPVSLWVAVALFVWANLRAALINPSPAWRQFARWLVG
jgi:hypothetical protein